MKRDGLPTLTLSEIENLKSDFIFKKFPYFIIKIINILEIVFERKMIL